MIKYPSYIRSSHAKKLFRYCVLHRVAAEKNPSDVRRDYHMFSAGWYGGMLKVSDDTWSIYEVDVDIHNEARRIYNSLEE